MSITGNATNVAAASQPEPNLDLNLSQIYGISGRANAGTPTDVNKMHGNLAMQNLKLTNDLISTLFSISNVLISISAFPCVLRQLIYLDVQPDVNLRYFQIGIRLASSSPAGGGLWPKLVTAKHVSRQEN